MHTPLRSCFRPCRQLSRHAELDRQKRQKNVASSLRSLGALREHLFPHGKAAKIARKTVMDKAQIEKSGVDQVVFLCLLSVNSVFNS